MSGSTLNAECTAVRPSTRSRSGLDSASYAAYMLAQHVSPPDDGTSIARSAMRLAGAAASEESMCQTAVARLYASVGMSMTVSSAGTDWSTENGSVHGVPKL